MAGTAGRSVRVIAFRMRDNYARARSTPLRALASVHALNSPANGRTMGRRARATHIVATSKHIRRNEVRILAAAFTLSERQRHDTYICTRNGHTLARAQ